MKTDLATIDNQTKPLTCKGLKRVNDNRFIPHSDNHSWIVQAAPQLIDQAWFLRLQSRPLLYILLR